jgi:hypothetical protein
VTKPKMQNFITARCRFYECPIWHESFWID